MQQTRSPVADFIALAAMFVANGFMIGCWATAIPIISNSLHINSAQLGWLLLAFAIGGIAMMLLTPSLIKRWGADGVAIFSGSAFIVLFAGPVWAKNYLTAFAATLAFGAANGTMDVAMNAAAIESETRVGGVFLSRLHGCYSVGAAGGAVACGLIKQDDQYSVSELGVIAGIAAVLLLPSLLLAASGRARKLQLTETRDAVSERSRAPELELQQDSRRDSRQPSQTRLLLSFSTIAFLCLITEGAMVDWLTKFMQTTAPQAGAGGFAFAAFALGMAVGRFAGDRLQQWLGNRALIAGGCSAAAFGLSLLLLGTDGLAAIPLMLIMGIGLANVIPIVFRCCGQLGSNPARSLAVVTATGYCGFLIAPPLIGWIAESSTLRAALWIVVVGVVVAGGLARLSLPAQRKIDPIDSNNSR